MSLLLLLSAAIVSPTFGQDCQLAVDTEDAVGRKLKETNTWQMAKDDHHWVTVRMIKRGDQYEVGIFYSLESLKEEALPRINEGQELILKLDNDQLLKLPSTTKGRATASPQNSVKNDGKGLKLYRYKLEAFFLVSEEQLEVLSNALVKRIRLKYRQNGADVHFDNDPHEKGQKALMALIPCIR